MERYYSTSEDYGTNYTVGNGNTCAVAIQNQVASADLTDLETADELKAEFGDRIDTAGNELYSAVDTSGGTDLAIVCYQIESSANITNYDGAANCCVNGGGSCAGNKSTDTYVCLPE